MEQGIFPWLGLLGITAACGGITQPRGDVDDKGVRSGEGGVAGRSGPGSAGRSASGGSGEGGVAGRSSPGTVGGSSRCVATDVVTFGDGLIEAAVREAAGVEPGEQVRIADAARVEGLSVDTSGESSRVDTPGVSSLDGLECLTSLQSLVIINGSFEDLSPLSGLTLLRAVHLANGRLADLSPLSSLQQLDWLYLDHNHVADVAPLSNLSKLYNLSLLTNRVSDVTPLLELPGLGELLLEDNPVDCNDPIQRMALTTLETRIRSGQATPPPDRPPFTGFFGPCP